MNTSGDIVDQSDAISNDDLGTIREMFSLCGMSVPAKGEFFEPRGSGPLLPLSRYGLVMRFLKPGFVNKRLLAVNGHDMLLQPLKLAMLDTSAVAILPGVRTVLTNELNPYLDFVSLEGARTGLETRDQTYNNIGLLPAPWLIDGQEHPFPVILDYGSFEPHYMSNDALRQKFHQAAWRGIQARTFAPVADRLRDAWPDGEALPRPAAIRKALAFCADIVNLPENDPGRLLVPGWQAHGDGVGKKMRNVRKIAENYEKRLQVIGTAPG